jgi:glutamate dehydrogenase (NADP+)
LINAVEKEVATFMKGVVQRNPREKEFQQAVNEFALTVMPWYLAHDEYRKEKVLDRLTEPDRVISFRITWEDDAGEVQINRGWRVQFNNNLGPYKGGLRFHSTVSPSVLKFLAFEQVFKNALTGLAMGGAKGGANFNPRGRSDREVMRFCYAMMTELHRHIGEDIDVPAGDIGVGSREISYLFGKYKQLQNRWAGAITGKRGELGGSLIRKEATGYGCIYFCEHALGHQGQTILGKQIAISGSGNVALYAAEKALDRGAQVVTLSDSNGTVFFKDGLRREQLEIIKSHKEEKRDRFSHFIRKLEDAEYHAGKTPWSFPTDIAMPCATQNEIGLKDVKTLLTGGVIAICEGANMPLTAEAIACVSESGMMYMPGKAANAGGVSVSGLEQSQNSMRVKWSKDEVDQKLQVIMREIHAKCVECGSQNGDVDYLVGANIAGLSKVAYSVHAFGIL